MKLRMKLMVAPALTAALLLASVGGMLWQVQAQRASSDASQAALMSARAAVYQLRQDIGAVHARLYRTVTIIGSLDEKAVAAVRGQLARELDKSAAQARQAVNSTDPALAKALQAFGTLVQSYRKAADNAIDLATVDPNTGVAALQTADGHFDRLSAVLVAVNDRVKAHADEEDAALLRSARLSQLYLGGLGALAAALSLAFAWALQRRIAREVLAASAAAVEVANGRLDLQLHSEANDELGELTRSLGAMVAHLRHSIQTVQAAAQNITTAGDEIASGNQDLSNRTEQAAGSLQQTAASMEQFTATVQQSAQSLSQANELAAGAAQIAERGGTVVGGVVQTMQDIHSSATQISNIISVIDGIAFQTNILALNAAVEAARAGEQGRGFAVVAAEVRNLAQRSAQAAKEIKGLIGVSVDKVACGSLQVRDAGQTMGEIVASVRRVSQIISEISVAAAEQSKGIGQVNEAVTHLDGMTQQNAALVEQSAASALSLSQQAQRLRDVANEFNLGR